MDKKTTVTFIINPISGTHRKDHLPQQIDKLLDHERFEYEVVFTEHRGHAAEIARQRAADKVDIVVAVGGDGTVNEVARSLVQSQTALGIIPCGSGNGLARHLCIPMNTKKAIGIINRCQIESFDYGVINGMPFFCTCGMGFDANVSLKFAQSGKRGLMTYVRNVIKEGLQYKGETYDITIDDGTTHHQAFLIACANASQYGNNAYIAPHASMQDGLMDVVIMQPFSLLKAPMVGASLFMKNIDKKSKVTTLRAQRIHIHRHAEGAIHYDGDPLVTGADIDVHIEHLGIRMLVNPDAKSTL